VKSLDRLGLGTSGGDVGHRLQPTRNSVLLMSVFSAHLYEFHAEFSSSTLERFKEKLQEVSDRIDNAGYTGSDEDGEVVSRLMDEVRAAIVDCQVSYKAQTGSGI